MRDFARFLLAFALVVAVPTAFAHAYKEAILAFFTVLTGKHEVVAGSRALPAAVRLLLPALAGLGVGAIVERARVYESRPEATLRGTLTEGHGPLSLRGTLWRAFAVLVSAWSGGSLGRETSVIQFGGSFAGVVSTRIGFTRRALRHLTAAGLAAGFAAGFGAPFAGALFAVESIAGFGSVALLPTAVAAAWAGTALSHAVGHGGPLYGVRVFGAFSPLELPAFAALAVFACLAERSFSIAREALKVSTRDLRPIHACAAGGLLTGLLACSVPEVVGNGQEPLRAILEGGLPLWIVATWSVTKLLATSSTVGSGAPGGVMTPTLLVGAGLGACSGTMVATLWIPGASPTGYAIVGMVAALASATRAPVFAVVLGLELTYATEGALPIALGALVAHEVARRFFPKK